MGLQSRATPDVAAPSFVLGPVAGLLADGGSLQDALRLLANTLGLSGILARSPDGTLLAAVGALVHAVPATRLGTASAGPIEIPLHGLGTLAVTGADRDLLPVLTAAASIMALSLRGSLAGTLLADAQRDLEDQADGLHDGAVQSLVVARYAADAVIRGGDPETARDALQRALVEVRRHLWHLRPRGGEDLASALTQLSTQRVADGASDLDLELRAAVSGPAGVLAYRLVQAVAATGCPVRVTVSRTGSTAVLLVVTTHEPLGSPDRWSRRAQALGGSLVCFPDRLHLTLPAASEGDGSPHPADADADAETATDTDTHKTPDARTAP